MLILNLAESKCAVLFNKKYQKDIFQTEKYKYVCTLYVCEKC